MNREMSSRERVKTVLAHKVPDRVPTDLWGSASRICDELYFDLLRYFDLPHMGDLIRPGTVTQFEDYALAERLDTDFRHINIGKPEHFKSYTDENGYVIDEWGVGRDVTALYPTVAYFPLAEAEEEDIDRYPWPDPFDNGRIRGLEQKAKDWYLHTDKAITATAANSGMFFEVAQFLRGPEEFFIDMCTNEGFAARLIDRIADILIDINLFYLKPIAPYLEWVEFTSDLGTQNAPFVSGDMFRQYFKEPFSRVFGAVKNAYPNLKVFFHSCGSIYSFIPDLIEAGVDVLNPIQPLAAEMDPARIKREFGRELVFHGAIDIQKAMCGSADDVEREVKLRIRQMAGDGGYILSPNNHLQNDVPAENVVKLYGSAREFGAY
jgi:uroporphyrinogen decarboxylase